jgi:3-methyladenine DNA glycosylase AlkC
MSEFVKDIIEVLVKHKMVNEHALRDFRVKQRYRELRKNGVSGKEARAMLAREERISEKTIQYILYGKKK